MPQIERNYLRNERKPYNIREAESIYRISTTLLKYFPIKDLQETERNGDLDIKGIDLVILPENNFAWEIGMATINVQAKSSEVGLDGFLSKGKKINKFDGRQWRELNLVVLNGQWPEGMITADFFYQLINLVGIKDNQFEINDLLDSLNPYVRQSYNRAINKGLLEQYRGNMTDWVIGRPYESIEVQGGDFSSACSSRVQPNNQRK